MRKPRALFGNAAFDLIAGSELVILEMVEALIARGWECDICAWHYDRPMAVLAREAGAQILPTPIDVCAFAYDLVWMQNRLEPVFDYGEADDEAERTLFVFAHLDARWSLAQPGVLYEPLLGGCFLALSQHGEDRIVARGLDRERVMLFRNPAPEYFVGDGRNSGLRSLAIVANRPAPELREAARLLRERNVAVSIWGERGDIAGQRITPSVLAEVDAVITIGKTVPYALRARRPIYVYGHFGGPGWLTVENFQGVAARNFSGLCCERKITPSRIADEIIFGFERARRDSAEVLPPDADAYSLNLFLDRLLKLQRVAATPSRHRERLSGHDAGLSAERELALALGHYFGAATRMQRKADATA